MKLMSLERINLMSKPIETIKSLDELKSRSNNNELECYILLSGILRSSKVITYYKLYAVF